MTLDGDASFPLQIHIIEHLSLGHADGLRSFKQAICQCAFTMVDVGDDAKVSDVVHIGSVGGIQYYI